MRGLNRLGTAIVVDIRKVLIVNDLRGGPAQVLDNQRLTKALISYSYTLFTLIRVINSIYGNSGEISIIKVKGIFYLFFLHCKAFILKHLLRHAGRRLSILVSRDKIIISQIRTSKAAFNLQDSVDLANVFVECHFHNFIRIWNFLRLPVGLPKPPQHL